MNDSIATVEGACASCAPMSRPVLSLDDVGQLEVRGIDYERTILLAVVGGIVLGFAMGYDAPEQGLPMPSFAVLSLR